MRKKVEFGNKENWYEDGWKWSVIRQAEMIKRLYPEYTPSMYVLWIVPDAFLPFMYERDKDIYGFIEVRKDGRWESIDVKIRKPYINKAIRQLALKNGRSSLYGIPLIFDSFEELEKVSGIHICWQTNYKKSNGEEIVGVTDIIYNISYIKSDNKRCYTVQQKDSTPLILGWYKKNDVEQYERWLNEFTDVSQIVSESDGTQITLRNYQNNQNESLPNWEKTTVLTTSDAVQIEKYLVDNSSFDSKKCYIVTRCDATEKIEASDFADISTEPSFGFMDAKPEHLKEYQSYINFVRDL